MELVVDNSLNEVKKIYNNYFSFYYSNINITSKLIEINSHNYFKSTVSLEGKSQKRNMDNIPNCPKDMNSLIKMIIEDYLSNSRIIGYGNRFEEIEYNSMYIQKYDLSILNVTADQIDKQFPFIIEYLNNPDLTNKICYELIGLNEIDKLFINYKIKDIDSISLIDDMTIFDKEREIKYYIKGCIENNESNILKISSLVNYYIEKNQDYYEGKILLIDFETRDGKLNISFSNNKKIIIEGNEIVDYIDNDLNKEKRKK